MKAPEVQDALTTFMSGIRLDNTSDLVTLLTEVIQVDKETQHRMISILNAKLRNQGNLNVTNYTQNAFLFRIKRPYFYDTTKQFWLWKNNKYHMVDETDILNMIEHELNMSGETVTSNVKSNYLEAFRRIGRTYQPQEPPKNWIQFKDIVVDITTNETFPVSPDYFFTNPIPWKIGDSYETPTIDKYFTEWVGEKYVETLKEMIAYCCYRDYPIHLIFCLTGGGSNGKSTFQRLLQNFLGVDNSCSTELDSLLDSRFESGKLFKKLACIMGETNFGTLKKTSLIKKLTGNDLVGFEFKQKLPFDAYNYAKIIISSNSLPVSDDTSEGFYRRWLIIDFPNQFADGKDILADIPDTEYEALAKQVMLNLPALINQKAFTNQGSIQQRKEKYIMASNPINFFIEKHCERGPDLYARYSEMYTAYGKYLTINKKRVVTRKEFSKVLVSDGFEVHRTSKEINGVYESNTFILGVKLKDGWGNIDFFTK